MPTPKVNNRSLNNQCSLCGQKISRKHNGTICSPCIDDLPWLTTTCQICAVPLPFADPNAHITCKQCLSKPPRYSKVHAFFSYNFPVNHLLSKTKYQRKPEYMGPLIRQICKKLPNFDHIDAVIAIPMHRRDLLKRGFNQALLIAKRVSKTIEKPLINQCLIKKEASKKQASLERKQRLQNLKNAFVCKTKPPKSILLIDDVMTTGTTVEVATQTLLAAGAEHVEIMVIARTPE